MRLRYVPEEWLEDKEALTEDAGEDIDDILVGLCYREVSYLLQRIGATVEESLIVTMWCKGLTDAEIAKGMSELFPVTFGGIETSALTKRRQRIIYRMSKSAGKDLGLITVLHDAFRRRRVH